MKFKNREHENAVNFLEQHRPFFIMFCLHLDRTTTIQIKVVNKEIKCDS